MPNNINPLHYLVENYNSDIPFVFKKRLTKLDNTPFFISNLPCNHQTIVIEHYTFTIENHHLTIFSDYIRSNQSDYHYTAEISEQNKAQRYILRVYIDAHNNVTTVSLKEQEKELPLSEADELFLSQTAKSFIAPITSQLRQVQHIQQTRLSDLSKNAIARLSQLPEQDLQSLDYCLSEASQAIVDAQSLYNLGGSNHSLQILLLLQKHLMWAKADWLMENKGHAQLVEALKEDAPEDEPLERETTPDVEPCEPLSLAKNPRVPKARDLEKQAAIASLNQQLETLALCKPKGNTDDHSPQQAIAYEHAARAALADLLVFEDLGGVGPCISLINESLVQSRDLCVQHLLTGLLEEEKFRKLDESGLADYVGYLSDNIVVLLVIRDLPEQLEWLLSKRQFPLDQLQATAQQKKQPLLTYAYEKQRLGCFEILLKHGASSLIAVANKYPLAHQILQGDSDPFYFALTKNIAHTEGGIQRYFKRLSCILIALCTHDILTPKERKDIESLIPLYQTVNAHQIDFRYLKLARILDEHEITEGSASSAPEKAPLSQILSTTRVTEKRECFRNAQREYLKSIGNQRGNVRLKSDFEIIAKLEKIATTNRITEHVVLEYLDSEIAHYTLETTRNTLESSLKQLKQPSGTRAKKLIKQLKALKISYDEALALDAKYALASGLIKKFDEYLGEAINLSLSTANLYQDIAIDELRLLGNLNKRYPTSNFPPRLPEIISQYTSQAQILILKSDAIRLNITSCIEEAKHAIARMVQPGKTIDPDAFLKLTTCVDSIVCANEQLMLFKEQSIILHKREQSELEAYLEIEDAGSKAVQDMSNQADLAPYAAISQLIGKLQELKGRASSEQEFNCYMQQVDEAFQKSIPVRTRADDSTVLSHTLSQMGVFKTDSLDKLSADKTTASEESSAACSSSSTPLF